MLAARLAGPGGEVVGVERDPAAVRSATARVKEAGFANVRFTQGDAQTLESVSGPFDAVVGRLVLPVWGWSDVVAALVPVMEQLGVASGAKVQPDTLEERLLAELAAAEVP